jgi:alanine racemase
LYTLKEIAQIVDGKLSGNGEITIEHLSTDTRKIQEPKSSVFFAINTEKSNGHLYLDQAISQNIAGIIVSQKPSSECNYIIVENTLVALQKLAENHRSKFNIDVVGVTGSNGKTIVKEWIAFLLNSSFSICKSPKSYNSQIGVPLSVWGLNDSHNLGVFEAGISFPNEMVKLKQIIKPTIGVFTHLGDAHASSFSSDEQKLEEKLLLFQDCKTIIASNSNPIVNKKLSEASAQLFFWGNNSNCDLQVLHQNGNKMVLLYQAKEYTFQLKHSDQASIDNMLSALSTALVLGVDMNTLAPIIGNMPEIDMRLQQIVGVNGNQLILDYYNSDYQSLAIALDFLKQQHTNSKTTVILSDILQSHLNDVELYSRVNQLLQSHKIDRFIGIGMHLKSNAELFNIPSVFYSNTQAFNAAFPLHELKDETILLKGARSFQFELIAEKLREKTHQTVLEVNLSRLQENINVIKSKLAKPTKLMAMVKALGYGSGGYQIAKLLEFNNIDYLGVAYTDEATELRQAGISLPFIVLNPDLNDLDPYLEQNIQPVIYSFESLKRIGNQPIKIHIEFDTGMHRLGFVKQDIPEIIEFLKNHPRIELVSVFSHLAAADDVAFDSFTQKQIADFQQLSSDLEESTASQFLKHVSNTAGIERFPNAQFDMVRLGVGLYGVSSLGSKGSLQPVSTFKSYITQIRTVPAGDGIGYGQHDVADHERQIAIIAVGYADGYTRTFSRGVGSFLIKGKKAVVVGNVCMDMTMCDVTNINCKAGDNAIIFGDNPRVEDLAKQVGTIPYEILTNVSERVNRVFYQE